MAFEPRLAEAAAVRVSPFEAAVSHGTWTCNVCDGDYPVGDSWLIAYEPGHALVACEGCAREARDELRSRG